MNEPIVAFRGTYSFLSNFSGSILAMAVTGASARSVEHAFQASKMTTEANYNAVLNAGSPGACKRLARSLPRRSDWEDVKLTVMEYYVRQKFSTNPYLLNCLRSTDDHYLIEGNNWGDIFWGAEWRIDQWYGQNHLGKILMKVRKELCA